ncbi:MAG TPA: acetyl-CoA carboxylase biotin carboxylase subunit [Acholeplasmataceae bacterium]|jgi:acetyl-CoA carboxylase biotin carboxylase subunit|nr:acetyl-CoA carboxylase biotin carboxylase subunit [Acholeplasmataceae bacterium]
MPNKVLIANRGEIALRIIRACKELGINTVAIYSKVDEKSLHVQFADEAICVGDAPSRNSYLNINNIISAAIATGCNAIHPGYGFLSENEKFAEIVEKCNLTFIGPTSEHIKTLGNKVKARQIAKSAGVPIVEGSKGNVETVEEAVEIANKIGYPILLKATCGGGGKGISLISSESELRNSFAKTRFEAESNFGVGDVYIEKYIENPRHIEVQILADKFGNIIHLGERDCSIQKRNQKFIEESPSPFVNERLRRLLGRAAIKLAKACNYQSAGTVEFIVDQKQNFYFMEMNTRIQVEHPVTEMVTGVDIVKEQIKIAYGHNLTYTQDSIKLKGHALECRITAEDPMNDFRPSPGLIKNLVLPGGFGIRIDTHLYNNYEVPPYYDSLLAKLIVHAPTRREAIRKMRVAIEQLIIDGIQTNIEMQYLIMHNPSFVRGIYDTSFANTFVKLMKENRNE